MPSLDSLRIRLEAEQTPRPDLEALEALPGYSATVSRRREGEASPRFSADSPDFGIGRIEYRGVPETTLIDVSARALGPEYLSGISRDTLPRLAEALTATGVLEVTAEDLADATVLRADATENLDVGGGVPEYLDALGILRLGAYRFDGTGGNVAFTGGPKRGGKQWRLSAYAKRRELEDGDADFIAFIGDEAFERSRGILRMERRASGFDGVREMAGKAKGTGEVRLGELLDAETRAVAHTYAKVLGRTPLDKLEALAATRDHVRACSKPAEVMKQAGVRSLLDECAGDLNLVREMLRPTTQTAASLCRALAPFHEEVRRRELGEHGPTWGRTMEVLDDIGRRLRTG